MRSIIVRGGTLLASVLLVPAFTGCGGSQRSAHSQSRPARTSLGLSSSAFLNGSSIPARYTCDGEDASPPLTWTRVPVRARSLALLVEDPDAPNGAFVHWSLYDLARGSSGLSAGRVPSGSAEGQNSFRRSGYGGPCPPKGEPAHRYVFSLYALNDHPGLPPGATPATVRAAIAAHAITTGTLTGLYRR
jgi:Raf kinase inhibitor-like YbhB/YbcL family protein